LRGKLPKNCVFGKIHDIITFRKEADAVDKANKLRGEDGCITLSVRLREGLCDELQRVADKRGISRNALIGELLREGIKAVVIV
jgi:predicted DNA-binding ribbon-helix-helix protein